MTVDEFADDLKRDGTVEAVMYFDTQAYGGQRLARRGGLAERQVHAGTDATHAPALS